MRTKKINRKKILIKGHGNNLTQKNAPGKDAKLECFTCFIFGTEAVIISDHRILIFHFKLVCFFWNILFLSENLEAGTFT